MPHEGHWSRQAKAAIALLLHGHTDKPKKVKRKILRDGYPFGARSGWPYRVWCREVRAVLGEPAKRKMKVTTDDGNQRTLFQ